jgi:hypothetical protein
VLAGAVVAVLTSLLANESIGAVGVVVTTLLWLPFPVGWFLLGYAAWRQASP